MVGKVALVSRGVCSFQIKAEFGQASGAVAVVVYNNAPLAVSPTLGVAGTYPITLIIPQVDGLALVESLKTAPKTVTVKVGLVSRGLTVNVIAETIAGDHENVILSGGHSDSVPAGKHFPHVNIMN